MRMWARGGIYRVAGAAAVLAGTIDSIYMTLYIVAAFVRGPVTWTEMYE